MPSPIAHAAAGYLIYRIRGKENKNSRWRLRLLLAALFFSLLPDADFLPGLLVGDVGRFHNQGTHSILAAIVVAAAAGLAARLWGGRARLWAGTALVSYGMHVVMDMFTYGGRGVKLFWPLSAQRFESPVALFIGARWSEGLWNPEHLVTLYSELVFTGVILFIAWLYHRLKGPRLPVRRPEPYRSSTD
jgi:inner membrane protein